MNTLEVLILHGSPGSGKTTMANAISEQLREAAQAHAVIDLDDISKVYPSQDHAFSRRGLKALWPNFAAIPNLKVIIPTVITDRQDHQLLVDAVASAKVIICELAAPEMVLKDRIRAREPNEYWQKRLVRWVDVYHQRDDSQKFGDFQVFTQDKSVEDTAREIIGAAGWIEKDHPNK